MTPPVDPSAPRPPALSLGRAGSLLLLTLLPFAAHYRLLLGQTYLFGDLRSLHFPYRTLLSGSLRHGFLPLWTPLTARGFPILAEGEGTFLSPLTWGLWNGQVPPLWAWNGTILLFFILAGTGMRALGKRLGLSEGGAFLAGAAWQGSGAVVGHLLQLNFFQGLALLPWVVERLLAGMEEGAWRSFCLVFSVFALSSHPQGAWVGLLLLLGFLILADSSGSLFRTKLLPFVASVVLAVTCALPQLLPTLELVARSARAGGMEALDVLGGSFPPWHLGTAAFPFLFGKADLEGGGNTYWSVPFWWEYGCYLGIIPLCLALHAVRRSAGQWRRLAWLAGAFGVLALGRFGPARWILPWLPGFNAFRIAGRYSVGAVFLGALFAGKGWDLSREKKETDCLFKWLPLAAFFGMLTLAEEAQFWEKLKGKFFIDPERNAWEMIVVLSAGFILVCWSYKPRAAAWAALALTVMDLGVFASLAWPTTPWEIAEKTPEAVAFLRAEDGQAAAVGQPTGPENRAALHALGAESNLRWGFPVVGYSATLQVGPFGRLMALVDQSLLPGKSLSSLSPEEIQQRENALNLLGAELEVAAPHELPTARERLEYQSDVAIFRRTGALPEVFTFQPGALIMANSVLDRLFSQRPMRENFGFQWEGDVQVPAVAEAGKAEYLRPGKVRLTHPGDRPFVWLSAFYPGWEVTEGKADFSPALQAFTLVKPARSGDMVLEYRPFSFRLGVFLGGLGWAGWLGWVVMGGRRRV